MLARVNRFIESQGAVAATQLAHSGRKGSVGPPWDRTGWVPPERGGWIPVAPSPVRDMPHYPLPHALSPAEIAEMVGSFAAAARRSDAAGYAITEIHAAHGYLLHEFLSPLSNSRDDAYGGSFANRCRFLFEVTDAVRAAWPERKPLFVRISATDWDDRGWSLDDSVELSKALAARGADMIGVSSGGVGHSPLEHASQAPLYQVPFSERIRREAGVMTCAVGLINTGSDAEAVLAGGGADLVAIGRKYLADTALPYRMAHEIGADLAWPEPYRRALL
jgi:2,4-dienoyl-CoA reductase-like NADH-dependent reductase (Old Yellow Enzyme family)